MPPSPPAAVVFTFPCQNSSAAQSTQPTSNPDPGARMDPDDDYMANKRREIHEQLKATRRNRNLLPLFEAMAQAASDGDDFVYDVTSLAVGLGLSAKKLEKQLGRLERLGFIGRHWGVVLIHPDPRASAKLAN